MLNYKANGIRSLDEELVSEGLDPDKVLGEIDRNIALMDQARPLVGAKREAPRALRTESANEVQDDVEEPAVFGEDDDSDEEFAIDGDDLDGVEFSEDDDDEDLEEGLKLKKMRGAAMRAKARRGPKYKKKLRMAKLYAKKFKAKIKRARAKVIRMAGGAAAYAKKAAMAHKAKKRLVMGMEELASLAEELESEGVATQEFSQYQEAAIDAGWLCTMLGEVFSCYGDFRAADALFGVAERSIGLSEDLVTVSDEEDLSEDQEEALTKLLSATQRALAAWESLGSPTLSEAVEYAVQEDIEFPGEANLSEDDDDDDDFGFAEDDSEE